MKKKKKESFALEEEKKKEERRKKTSWILECLKALETRAIHEDAPRTRLESPGRVGHIITRLSKGMNWNDLDALYANISSEYTNSIMKSDFKVIKENRGNDGKLGIA